MSEVQINEIPFWCDKIFNEEQKDPDKDPGFLVTARLWDPKGIRLFESSFMFVGQEQHMLKAAAENAGVVDTCTVYWKNKSCECSHDMHGLKTGKGDPCEVRLNNLRQLS